MNNQSFMLATCNSVIDSNSLSEPTVRFRFDNNNVDEYDFTQDTASNATVYAAGNKTTKSLKMSNTEYIQLDKRLVGNWYENTKTLIFSVSFTGSVTDNTLTSIFDESGNSETFVGQIWINVYNKNVRLYFRQNDWTASNKYYTIIQTSDSPISQANVFYDISICGSGNDTHIYVNGTESALSVTNNVEVTLTGDSDNSRIGHQTDGQYLNGYFDLFELYDETLTPEQISELSDRTMVTPILPARSYELLNDAQDYSLNKKHATINGSDLSFIDDSVIGRKLNFDSNDSSYVSFDVVPEAKTLSFWTDTDIVTASSLRNYFFTASWNNKNDTVIASGEWSGAWSGEVLFVTDYAPCAYLKTTFDNNNMKHILITYSDDLHGIAIYVDGVHYTHTVHDSLPYVLDRLEVFGAIRWNDSYLYQTRHSMGKIKFFLETFTADMVTDLYNSDKV